MTQPTVAPDPARLHGSPIVTVRCVTAMNGADAQEWDAATVEERRAMLMDAIGTDQMQVLPFTGKRGTIDPLRIVAVPKRELLSAPSRR